jgi:glyoxylase-like metal-dependent hydrolase (beta-lactamase superfamily II)/rhodanese-related sulfurtransferase
MSGRVLLRQVVHEDLGCASYLVGDTQTGVAAVVDPRYDVAEYLELADYLGVRIAHVLETHTHADHVSGHGRLAAATGATVHVQRLAGAAYPHEPFDDGWELALGALRIRALHTPGHRPEHTAFALHDGEHGGEPWAVLTGDSLFAGDVARPDLAVEQREGARELFHSLHERLLALPDATEVWPGHLGGSMCGGPGMDLKTCSTIGWERRHNARLQTDDEQRFVSDAVEGLGPQPPNFEQIAELNRGPLLLDGAELPPLQARDVECHGAAGALVVDVRTDLQFDDAHIPGAVAITIHTAGFGTKLAWVAAPEQPIVLVGRDDADAEHAAALALAVGVRTFAGRLVSGMPAWCAEGRELARFERVAALDLPARRAAEPELQVLDVRERFEWDGGHLAGSLHAPYHELAQLPDGLDPLRPVAAICASGQRSAVAASLLGRHGVREVVHVVQGGVGTLGRAGEQLVS